MCTCSIAGPNARGDALPVVLSGGSGATLSFTSGEKEKEKAAAEENVEDSCGHMMIPLPTSRAKAKDTGHAQPSKVSAAGRIPVTAMVT